MATDVTISRTRPEPPPQRERSVSGVAPALRLLADPLRAAILDRLADEELCVCHLQE